MAVDITLNREDAAAVHAAIAVYKQCCVPYVPEADQKAGLAILDAVSRNVTFRLPFPPREALMFSRVMEYAYLVLTNQLSIPDKLRASLLPFRRSIEWLYPVSKQIEIQFDL